MKIYTKTGDQGETGLLGGVRVPKSHLAIEVCGCLDETNSLIGLAQCHLGSVEDENCQLVSGSLSQIQNDLFDLGSRVAACVGESARPAEFPTARITQLEEWIDQYQAELPPLTQFILPGGGLSGSTLHLARAICRKTERRLVTLIGSGVQRELKDEMIYLNRLGDLIFVMARVVNLQTGSTETNWSVTR